MKEKRLYSITLVAYLILEGCEDYEIRKDEVNADKCYFVFPETNEVQNIIDEYKNVETLYVDLRKYNQVYKKIKSQIYKIREDEANE